jgi:DNA-binding transcriptional MerR regulator
MCLILRREGFSLAEIGDLMDGRDKSTVSLCALRAVGLPMDSRWEATVLRWVWDTLQPQEREAGILIF